MSGRPRQASGGVDFCDTGRRLGLLPECLRGWRRRPLRPGEHSLIPWRTVPVFRVKAPSRPMPAEAGA